MQVTSEQSEYRYRLPGGGIVHVDAASEDEAHAALAEILARDFPDVDPDAVEDA